MGNNMKSLEISESEVPNYAIGMYKEFALD